MLIRSFTLFLIAISFLVFLPARAQEGEGSPPQPAAPPGWVCAPFAFGDGSCDCGCGVADTDCSSPSVDACEQNHCRANDAQGVPINLNIDSANAALCVPGACGDGIQANTAEECDDGNTLDGDGCRRICLIERGWDCGSELGRCVPIVCGDGLQSFPDESCDDGNDRAGDGCSPSCSVEPGYECFNDVCTRLVCGDGVQASLEEHEECDDGNARAGDGCDDECRLEDGYSCSEPGAPCVPCSVEPENCDGGGGVGAGPGEGEGEGEGEREREGEGEGEREPADSRGCSSAGGVLHLPGAVLICLLCLRRKRAIPRSTRP